ncbi:MAG: GAF domain-containing protein [Anaerolineae bacterium]|nr:GAF domain-containing protein [Anaerolineae bacterium]
MGKKKILIVEDEELVARLTRQRVEAMGYIVTGIANNANEAIQRVLHTSPDLILMDIFLSGKTSGIEAAEKILAIRDIPVIYMTAYSDEDTVSKAKLTHPFGYVIKPFEDRELQILIELTFQINQEIAARKQTEEALKHQALEQETLRAAALALTNTLDRREVIERILAQLQAVVPYDTASVQLLREGRLHIVGGRGFPNPDALLDITFDTQSEETPNHEVIRSGRPFIVDDVPANYPSFQHPLYMAENTRSWMGVPMCIGEHLIGMITLDCETPGFYTPAHARLAETFAAQAAVAVENSRLFQAEREQRELAEALEETALVLNSTLAPDQVLDRILAQIQRIVAGNTYSIMLVGPDNQARYARWRGHELMGISVEQIINTAIPMSHFPNLEKMLQTGKSIIVSNIAEEQTAPGWQWLRAQISAAIRVKKDVVGFLNVGSDQPDIYTATDLHRLEIFAQYAAAAIQNAQLHQQLQAYTDELEQRVHQRTAELRSQYAQLEAILRSTRDGIVVTRMDGTILQTNPVAQRWLKQTLAPEEAQRLHVAIRQVAQHIQETCTVGTGTGFPAQQPFALLELTGLDLEVSGAPIIQSTQECNNPMPVASESQTEGIGDIVIVIHDVSHLKALERMKNDFITNISHEFRTPIATLKSYTHLLQTRPEKYADYLPAIVQQLERQTQLVEDVVELARLDAGRAELNPHPMALQPFVAAQVATYEVIAFPKNLQIVATNADLAPMIIADPDYLARAVAVLMHNAIAYTPAGGQITIATRCQTVAGREWGVLSVTDTGFGIEPEDIPHIFERFFRGHRPQHMQIQGTGLGLPIAKAIVELHGGHITVESQEGKGSTFTLWLPLDETCA